jgi:hypothetical protein
MGPVGCPAVGGNLFAAERRAGLMAGHSSRFAAVDRGTVRRPSAGGLPAVCRSIMPTVGAGRPSWMWILDLTSPLARIRGARPRLPLISLPEGLAADLP